MKIYKTKHCKDCEYYQGIKDFGDGNLQMICDRFGLLKRGRIIKEEKLEALKANCFKLKEKEEILNSKIRINFGILSSNLNWKELLKKIWQKTIIKTGLKMI